MSRLTQLAVTREKLLSVTRKVTSAHELSCQISQDYAGCQQGCRCQNAASSQHLKLFDNGTFVNVRALNRPFGGCVADRTIADRRGCVRFSAGLT